jgi:5-methylcytosine-specific restriction endonuclease McrA
VRRKTWTRLQRVKIFDAAKGKCHLCGHVIFLSDKWDVDHIKPLWLGGEDVVDNLGPAHERCHRAKTSADAPVKAKGDRIRARHLGVEKSNRKSWGYGKSDKFKKTVGGRIVPRVQRGG